jgi:hypothetical protein
VHFSRLDASDFYAKSFGEHTFRQLDIRESEIIDVFKKKKLLTFMKWTSLYSLSVEWQAIIEIFWGKSRRGRITNNSGLLSFHDSLKWRQFLDS